MLNIRIKQVVLSNKTVDFRLRLDILEGTIIGITGENAEDFLTLITDSNTIVGDVVIDCISMIADYEEYINKLAILVDNVHQNTQSTIFTVEEYVDFYHVLWNYELKSESLFHYEYLLQALKCEYLLKQKVNLLSHNDLQKLKFVTSMMKKPSLIIISKFFDCIDFMSRKLMWDYLKKYCMHGGICIVISQDLIVLESVSNKIYSINFNKLINIRERGK